MPLLPSHSRPNDSRRRPFEPESTIRLLTVSSSTAFTWVTEALANLEDPEEIASLLQELHLLRGDRELVNEVRPNEPLAAQDATFVVGNLNRRERSRKFSHAKEERRDHDRYWLHPLSGVKGSVRNPSVRPLSISDLSQTGMRVETVSRLEIGRTYETELNLFGIAHSTRGKVVWSKVVGSMPTASGNTLLYRVGLDFKTPLCRELTGLLGRLDREGFAHQIHSTNSNRKGHNSHG